MDLREIQALHAHYATQPVTIDIAGQVASMPALPAPDDVSERSVLPGTLRRIVRPVSIGLAVGALAVGTVLGAYHLYQLIHTPAPLIAAAKKEAAVPVRPPAPATPQDQPIDAAPARPLTSRDLDGGLAAPRSALSSIDTRQLSPAIDTRPGEQRAASTTTQPAMASVAASPIHAAHASAPATPAPATTVPTTPVAAPEPTQARRTPELAATAMPASVAVRPAEKTIHHPVHHRAAEPVTERTAGAPTPAPEATKPPPPVGKSGDVQLF
jgi:hypothetical protein